MSFYGPMESLELYPEPSGLGQKNYAFVTFKSIESASIALQALSNLGLAGRILRVVSANDGNDALLIAGEHVAVGGGGGNPMMGGVNTASGRQMLMAKLGESAGASVPFAPNHGVPLAVPVVAAPIIPPLVGIPSLFLLIRNLFDPSEETDEGWDLDIQEDVTEECLKFGKVLACRVEKNKPGGLVYMHFESIQGASASAKALHGRFFAKRMITAEYISEFEEAS